MANFNTDVNLSPNYGVTITQKPVKSNDGLFETYTTIFKDKASFDEFIQNSLSTSNKITLELWCAENGVICSNEHSES